MIRLNVQIDSTARLERKLKEIARGLKSSGVEAGILSGTGTHPNADGATVAEVGIWNEFGTRRIPARPWMRATLRMRRRQYRQEIFSQLKALLHQKTTLTNAERRIGMRVQRDLRDTIKRLSRPRNAPRTVIKKGSSNPLIDTGFLRQSINWAAWRRR